ncbi:DUF6089 family protein [Sphingobacterium spiritivorum]|uniref:type IX secretion system protein PorG n=1 Tax=Sphingobacterium spiritivorum TaxID=258 RepID=UPI003DA22E65
MLLIEIHYLYRKKTILQRLFYSLLVLICFFPICNLSAQQWELGANLGTTGYMGDINPNNPLYFKSLGGGLTGKYNFNPTWGVKGGINYLHLFGSDANSSNERQIQRNLAFQNKVVEISAIGEFNFFRFVPGKNKLAYTPYIFAGVAAIYHNPYVKFSTGEKYDLRDLQLEYDAANNPGKYSKFALAIPFGAGFKYNIKGPWTVGAELNYRVVLSDNIDNVNRNYATSMKEGIEQQIDPLVWESLADRSGNWEANKGKLRGDGRPHDAYMTFGLTVTYTFISQKCYWW